MAHAGMIMVGVGTSSALDLVFKVVWVDTIAPKIPKRIIKMTIKVTLVLLKGISHEYGIIYAQSQGELPHQTIPI